MCLSTLYQDPSGLSRGIFCVFDLFIFLEQNALLTNLRKVSHIELVGGGWRGHRRRDLALHRPLNLVGSIYLPHNVDSSAIVITRMYFLHWFAC